jgi:hypothetical protein
MNGSQCGAIYMQKEVAMWSEEMETEYSDIQIHQYLQLTKGKKEKAERAEREKRKFRD